MTKKKEEDVKVKKPIEVSTPASESQRNSDLEELGYYEDKK